MVMDPSIGGFYGSTSKFRQITSVSMDRHLSNGLRDENPHSQQDFADFLFQSPDPNPFNLAPSPSVTPEVESPEDYDFSDVVLKYISQMLMEEDMDEKNCMFQESSALQAAEKSFYDVIGEKYPPSPDHNASAYLNQNHGCPAETINGDYNSSSTMIDPVLYNSITSVTEENSTHFPVGSLYDVSHSTQLSHTSSSSSPSGASDGWVDSPVSTLKVPDVLSDDQSILQFKKGFEEGIKFLANGLSVGLEKNVSSRQESTEVVKSEKKAEPNYSPDGLRGRKNPHPEDADIDGGRSNKQSAVYSETTLRSEMFDMVLLCTHGHGETVLREVLHNGGKKNVQQNVNSKGSNGGKGRGKKQGGKRDLVDLRILLTLCAQAISTNDQRNASELLKQIRQHSSPAGDGLQRMAHYFANGLEARLAGTGTQIYTAFITKPTKAADVLKAYHLLLGACPFKKISNFFANRSIMDAAEKATRLHIIDFGIMYGFQWPCLIQRLSCRPGGPPKLKITGIDFPQPGFRPAERVEETGQRLRNYAESFKVPFEFNAIAQKWETIHIEDLNLDSDEVLVVNCLYRFRNLLDETVVVESPRNKVLNLIKEMKPDLFINGIVNGAYCAPFFITRFREALFHFSSLFDILETIVPREIPERLLLEKVIYGREAMNVIACEGSERLERPETYKQWQVRISRAGFRQLPLNPAIVKKARDWVDSSYHEDFVLDEDGRWFLQGWKGLWALQGQMNDSGTPMI
ncbi:Transcription factor GRAS [Dillenia turbinata]|uniref:Transcription factor GRAS n=1 Tax=Dillenia turbinata TaxID=194707 RepID=A0AAN8Z958_9MAGN